MFYVEEKSKSTLEEGNYKVGVIWENVMKGNDS